MTDQQDIVALGGDAVRVALDAQGILTLTLDMPGRSANVLNEALTGPLAALIARIDSDAAVKGVIITSAKKDFLVGADIDELYTITDPAAAKHLADAFKDQMRRLETSGKPVAAALNGSALGGGLELALACHHRVALNSPKLKLGLPEVKLGLLPGGGGTQRLPRLIGIQAALPLLTEGRELRPEQALEQGIIHALAASADELLVKARQWIEAALAAGQPVAQPWDRKGFKFPGGDARSPANAQLWAIAPSMLRQKTHGNYPAPLNILSSVFEGGLVDFDTALKVESRYFAELAVGREAKNMIGTLWYQLNKINRGESRPEGHERRPIKKLGVLGAGMMGAGIAYVSAQAGIEVVLKDVDQASADKGKAYSAQLEDKAIAKGRGSEEKKRQLLERIQATGDDADLAGCDLIIEAVFEDRELKAKVTAEAEAVMEPSGVFGSNTSTLPITGLAQRSSRPHRFIGIHFFSPVEKMPLVEIIVGEQTSDETLARAFDYVQQIRKTPIVVNDSRGFYTSRCFSTYVMEGLALLADGQHPRTIEQAGLAAGMPVGPLALQDEVSLSLALHVMNQTRKDFEAEGKAYREHPGEAVIRTMVEELDRPGKRAGRGFYDYPEGGRKRLWPGLAEHWPVKAEPLSQQEMVDRLLYVQANETARCYEEGVLRSVPDANIGSIFGWGFAPFHGGTLQFINSVGGSRAFIARAHELAEAYGERFAPAQVLVEMAERGEDFPGR
ncbi:3-hydroxyacyl-CoA dehydrogenase NAD-binding domain-containing protein [Stutzerimonas stutzeri]|uniref:3-hydroxyacyl-CoA dehydrogenase NAD-binding domain-containing protein n=1 Tax=Stutzerimonas stutzeri TaxID=316 RepID=UPI00210BDFA5|nr:3-hydroxyacyl-CoA dehydrogenase NAD-binding domain-containing protein [Stutzerimonas stutzeri]MCQ4322242.1 3-hydroxyacyl-CoA dehydrogenase NAD-binding domain-containing protein [Stutzerimonas stutzeri]